MTAISKAGDPEEFRLTQSLIVMGIVVGGVFIILIVTNIALGFLLWVHHRRRSKRGPKRHGLQEEISGPDNPSSKKGRSKKLRITYKRRSKAETGSFDEGHETLAFEEQYHEGESGSSDSSESEASVMDKEWRIFQGQSTRNAFTTHTQRNKLKWDALLSNDSPDARNGKTIESSHNQIQNPSLVREESFLERKDKCLDGSSYPKGIEESHDRRRSGVFLTSVAILNDLAGDLITNNEEDGLDNVAFQSNTSLQPKSRTATDAAYVHDLGINDVTLPIRPTKYDSKVQTDESIMKVHDESNQIERQMDILSSNDGGFILQRVHSFKEIVSSQPDTLYQVPHRYSLKRKPHEKYRKKGHNKKDKSHRPGKLYRKTNDSVKESTKERTAHKKTTKRLSSPPPARYTNESFVEDIFDEEQAILASMEMVATVQTPSTNQETITKNADMKKYIKQTSAERGVVDIERKNYLGSTVKLGDGFKERAGINQQLSASCLPIEQESDLLKEFHEVVVDFESKDDFPRSPVLDWSISDDDKQCYFNHQYPSCEVNVQPKSFSSTTTNLTPKNAIEDENHSKEMSMNRGIMTSDDIYPKVTRHSLFKISNNSKEDSDNNVLRYSHENNKNKTYFGKTSKRRSFVHRLLNRQKHRKTQQMLKKSFHSEDSVHTMINDRLNVNRRGAQLQRGEAVNAEKRKSNEKGHRRESKSKTNGRPIEEKSPRGQYQFISSSLNQISENKAERYGLGPFIVQHFTLSEDDLGMFPDNSIPTIDELVLNGTIKIKKARRRRSRQVGGKVTKLESTNAIGNDSVGSTNPSRQQQQNDSKEDNKSNLSPEIGEYCNSDANKNDTTLVGFHTGVLDKYHSISGRGAPTGHNISFQHRLDVMASRIGLRGPVYIPEPSDKENNNEALTHGKDDIKDNQGVSEINDFDDGNWNISFMSARSNSSREVDSLSSFALSDFDMGESDVDDISKGGHEEGNDNRKDEETTRKVIGDVHL